MSPTDDPTDAIPAAPADAPDVPVAPGPADDPELVPEDEQPVDVEDGVDPTDDGLSVRTTELPPEAQ